LIYLERNKFNKGVGKKMKKVISIVLAAIMLLSSVVAVGVGAGVGVIIEPEQFEPRVFLNPSSRLVLDDYTEPGAVTGGEEFMFERVENYAFEGEQIVWDVLVWDKNGKEKVSDVFVELHQTVQVDGYIESNCRQQTGIQGLGELTGQIFEGEEMIEWNQDTMYWYACTLTVETPNSMHGEYMVSAVATDLNGLEGRAAESELWFLNPVIALGITGSLNFGVVRPGATVLSDTVVVTNSAEAGSGVMLDMFIAGTDFYDPSHSGASCPTSNVLRLRGFNSDRETGFRYYASSGSYNTCGHPGGNDAAGADAQCYVQIPYYVDGAGAGPNNNMNRIVDGTPVLFGGVYPAGNILSPGADMSMNFKLALPEPCNGGPFTDGEIKIFGEAV
jgi:hypothetical protein